MGYSLERFYLEQLGIQGGKAIGISSPPLVKGTVKEK